MPLYPGKLKVDNRLPLSREPEPGLSPAYIAQRDAIEQLKQAGLKYDPSRGPAQIGAQHYRDVMRQAGDNRPDWQVTQDYAQLRGIPNWQATGSTPVIDKSMYETGSAPGLEAPDFDPVELGADFATGGLSALAKAGGRALARRGYKQTLLQMAPELQEVLNPRLLGRTRQNLQNLWSEAGERATDFADSIATPRLDMALSPADDAPNNPQLASGLKRILGDFGKDLADQSVRVDYANPDLKLAAIRAGSPEQVGRIQQAVRGLPEPQLKTARGVASQRVAKDGSLTADIPIYTDNPGTKPHEFGHIFLRRIMGWRPELWSKFARARQAAPEVEPNLLGKGYFGHINPDTLPTADMDRARGIMRSLHPGMQEGSERMDIAQGMLNLDRRIEDDLFMGNLKRSDYSHYNPWDQPEEGLVRSAAGQLGGGGVAMMRKEPMLAQFDRALSQWTPGALRDTPSLTAQATTTGGALSGARALGEAAEYTPRQRKNPFRSASKQKR